MLHNQINARLETPAAKTNLQIIMHVRSHAASGQNGERALNTSIRIISAECVFNSCIIKRSETEFGLNRQTFQNGIWGKQPNEKKKNVVKNFFMPLTLKSKLNKLSWSGEEVSCH